MLEMRLPARLWQRRFVIACGLALAAGVLIGARIALNGEFWLDRTYHLVVIAMFGAFFGAFIAWIGLAILPFIPVRAFPRLSYFIAFGLCFMGAMGVAFVIQTRIFVRDFELNPDRPIMSLLWSSAETFGLFLISSPAYLLPWVLPVLCLIALELMPYGDAHLRAVEPSTPDV